MKVLPGDVVSYKDESGSTRFLTVSTVTDTQVVGTEILLVDQDNFQDGETVTIDKSAVDAIR